VAAPPRRIQQPARGEILPGPKDYWLFDSSDLWVMQYADDGAFPSTGQVTEPAMIVTAAHRRDAACTRPSRTATTCAAPSCWPHPERTRVTTPAYQRERGRLAEALKALRAGAGLSGARLAEMVGW